MVSFLSFFFLHRPSLKCHRRCHIRKQGHTTDVIDAVLVVETLIVTHRHRVTGATCWLVWMSLGRILSQTYLILENHRELTPGKRAEGALLMS